MKYILVFLAIVLLTSCADSQDFQVNGQVINAKPYGWANRDSRKIEGVVYEVNGGNIVWDIILCETIVVPIWLTGWQLYEPVAIGSTKFKSPGLIQPL